MSDHDTPAITVDFLCANPRPLPPVIAEAYRKARHDELARQEAEAREHIEYAGTVFLALTLQRHKWDPRRLGDHYAARRCLRLTALSRKADPT